MKNKEMYGQKIFDSENKEIRCWKIIDSKIFVLTLIFLVLLVGMLTYSTVFPFFFSSSLSALASSWSSFHVFLIFSS